MLFFCSLDFLNYLLVKCVKTPVATNNAITAINTTSAQKNDLEEFRRLIFESLKLKTIIMINPINGIL